MTDISYERNALNNVSGAPNMRLRWQWNARRSYSNNRNVTHPGTRVFIHISITNPNAYRSNDAHARAIESIGINRFPSTGISYNRGIMHNGDIYEFQPMTRRGAHTVNDHRRSSCNRWGDACPGHGKSLRAPSWNLNYNTRAYVICQNVGDSVTDDMIDSLAKQIVADYEAGFITHHAAHNMHGHRCVASKSCPGGNMWARMYDLHSRVHTYMNDMEADDMPSPKDWDSADWTAFQDKVEGVLKYRQFIPAPGGGKRWSFKHVVSWLASRSRENRFFNERLEIALEKHSAGTIDAEQVVEELKAMLHAATQPEDSEEE